MGSLRSKVAACTPQKCVQLPEFPSQVLTYNLRSFLGFFFFLPLGFFANNLLS